MENIDMALTSTLSEIQGDDTVFIVQLIDISHELAADMINSIQECKGLDDVICRYFGDYKTGMAEFIVKKRKPMLACGWSYEEIRNIVGVNGVPVRPNVAKDNPTYRHLVTTLCAALNFYIYKHTTVVERFENFKSLIFDNMFDLKMFNCISARLNMIERCKAESRDFVKCISCSACPLRHFTLGKCSIPSDFSEPFNRYLGYLTLDEDNKLLYSSRSDDSGLGLLTAKFITLNNFTNWLDFEQFLDTKGLF